jgi:soluble lytic murein transglycosylase
MRGIVLGLLLAAAFASGCRAPANPSQPLPAMLAPQQASNPGARFAEAYRLIRSGDNQQARPLLESLRDYPPLRDYTLHYLALACSRTDAAAQALDLWTELVRDYPQSLLFAQAVLDRGRLHRARGEAEQARADFTAARNAGGPAVSHAARLELAEVELEAGQIAAAYAELMTLRRAAAGTASGRRARRQVAELRRAHPELRPHGIELRDELDLLMEEHAHAEAIELADQLLPTLAIKERPLVMRQKADALYAAGRFAVSLAILDEVAADYAGSPAAPAALFRAASLRWNRDLDEEAGRQFRDFRRRYPHHSLMPDVLYALARIEQDSGRLDVARDLYRQLIQDHPDNRVARDGRWRLAWLDYRSGRWLAAAAAFERLSRDGEDAAAASYWQARALERGGDHAAARRRYQRLLTDAPASYYAYWSEQRLAVRKTDAPALSVPPAPAGLGTPPSTARERFHFERAEALRGARLLHLAREELRAFERDNEGAAGLPRHLARAYAAVHAYRDAIRAQDGASDDPTVLYPLAFWSQVSRLTAGSGLDPLLMLALIRQESMYDPGARSPADARGLMQLLPQTAERVAGRAIAPEDLYDAALNLELGIAHFKDLVSRYGGDVLKALAAYNGGEAAVRKWEQRFGDLPMDEFVESITYRETRDYVKKVMSHYRRYQQLYAQPPSPGREVKLRSTGSENAAAGAPLTRPSRKRPRCTATTSHRVSFRIHQLSTLPPPPPPPTTRRRQTCPFPLHRGRIRDQQALCRPTCRGDMAKPRRSHAHFCLQRYHLVAQMPLDRARVGARARVRHGAYAPHVRFFLMKGCTPITITSTITSTMTSTITSTMTSTTTSTMGLPIPVVDETHVTSLADDDVVEHPHSNQIGDLAQPAGQLDVFLAGGRIAARVIVNEDYGGRRLADDGQIDFPRMHNARRERALRDANVLELAVLVVEEDGVELLVALVAETLAEVGIHVIAAAKRRAGHELLLAETFGDFERGLNLRRLGGADPFDRTQLRQPQHGQAPEAAAARLHQRSRLSQSVLSFGAGAQHHREQLGRRERRGALIEKLLARPLRPRPLLDRLGGHAADLYVM